MSLRVMIVPEDPTNDRYIVKPLVSAILDDLGSRTEVQVLTNPRIRGFEPALGTHRQLQVMIRIRHNLSA